MDSTANFLLTDENLNSVLDALTKQTRIFRLDFFKMNPDLDSRWNRGYIISIYKVELNNEVVFAVHFDDKTDGGLEVYSSRLAFFNTEDEAMEAVGKDYNAVYRNITQ